MMLIMIFFIFITECVWLFLSLSHLFDFAGGASESINIRIVLTTISECRAADELCVEWIPTMFHI